MRKKRNDFDAVGVERMTDAELSKKLGSYQRTEDISISLGVILVIAACITMFIRRDPLLVCALAFPGVALFLLVAKPGPDNDNWMTRTETLFRGIVVRCKDICDLALALNTQYVFAGIPEWLDLRDIDGIRKWFTASLTGMGNLLDLITESPALTGAGLRKEGKLL